MLLAALALSGCVKPRVPWLAAPVVQQHSELDAMMYGAPAPPSATVRRVREVVPVVPVDDGPYTLDTGDKLRIVVFGQDALSNTYIVDAEGQVALPLIGAVTARGLTTRELAGSIKSRLAQGFIREPSVAVEIEIYRPFFVLGEVTYPGQYPYVPNMTVESAIAIAGGFTPRGFKSPSPSPARSRACRPASPCRCATRSAPATPSRSGTLVLIMTARSRSRSCM